MTTFAPHDYQFPIMQHIHTHPRAGVFAGMGTGKTATTLLALDHMSLVADVWPALVLAPIRVARSTWPDEVAKWDNLRHLRVTPVVGTPKERLKALESSSEIFTINYENVPWLVDHFQNRWPFKTIIADEWTRLKGYRTRQGSVRARALARVAHTLSPRFIGLTGSPAPRGLEDLWGQLWFLDRGARLGHSFRAFSERWFDLGWDGYSLTPKAHANQEIRDAIRDVCLSVSGLPVDQPIRTVIPVDLPPKARALYRDMEKDMYLEIEDIGLEVAAATAAVRTTKCHQIANGALYVDEDKRWEEFHRAKLEALDSIIAEASGAPVLVAYHFKHDLERLQAAFPHGRVLDTDPQTIREWNAGNIPLLFAHPASAGHGLNLAQGGNILVFFSINWNLEEHEQIIERLGPMRQKQAGLDRPVYLYFILARNTVDDQLILPRLELKDSVQTIFRRGLERFREAA